MKNNNIFTRFAKLFAAFPIITIILPFGGIPNSGVALDTVPEEVVLEMAAEEAVLELQAKAIDAYYAKYNLPLEGQGLQMALVAKKYSLDWRLIPAIAMRESTGGKFACGRNKTNAFGWHSCKVSFDSHAQAIETVALNISGNNSKTAHYYAGKTTEEILKAYNPPSVVPRYSGQVMAIMDDIGVPDLGLELVMTDTNKKLP